MQKAQKGFTLIELLIVIAIISVLLGVVAVTLNPLERIKESRDSRRQQDLQSVRKALDLALADGEITLVTVSTARTSTSNGTSLALDSSNQTSSGWVLVEVPSGKTGLIKYMPALPDDPQGSSAPDNGYQYLADATTDCYEVSTAFETSKYQQLYTQDGGNSSTRWELGPCVGSL